MKTAAKNDGFTLLEVLIALAIVALAVGALLGTVTSSASNLIYLKDKALAQWIALNRLTEMRIAQVMPDPGRRTGFTEMAGQKWQWESEVIELPVVKGLFRIEIHVRPTGESVDDQKTVTKDTAQKEPESKSGGSELDKLSWTGSAVGVVGTSRSAVKQSIAVEFGAEPQNGTPGTPGTPNTPGGKVPGGPGQPTVPPRGGVTTPDR